jgi:predicted exporter
MNFPRRRLTGWSILVAATLLGTAWLLHFDYHQKITTDVLDLIPANEQSPELSLVRSLASEAEARTMLFVLAGSPGKPVRTAAALEFAAALRQSPKFAEVVALNDSAPRDAVGRELFARRFPLLFPLWLDQEQRRFEQTRAPEAEFTGWLARDAAQSLNQFLSRPAAMAFQDIIPADPLLLMPAAAERLKPGLALVQPSDSRSADAPALVWGKLTVSPLSEEGQQPVFAAIDRAVAAVRASHPEINVTYTGINRFAAASRARIETEVTRLNLLSLAAVIAVALIFIPGVHRTLHLVPGIALAVLGAWVVATAAFERVHIFVFVVGSLLTGVAIDYGFYLYMQPPVGPSEDYWGKVRRLAKPLLASCFTTVAGFALLLFSELPVIRQLGAFVGAGLICALAAAVVYFSTVRNPYLAARTFGSGASRTSPRRSWVRRATIGIWLVALIGLLRLTWRDNIQDLEIPSPELKRTDAAIRAQFGGGSDRSVLLTYADTLSAARDRLEELNHWLQAHEIGYFNLGLAVPTQRQFDAATRFARVHADFAERLRTALVAAGFEREAFDPFIADFESYRATADTAQLDEVLAGIGSHLTGPLGLLMHGAGRMRWFVTLVDHPLTATLPVEVHTVAANQLETLNTVFSRYRRSALWLSAAGLAIVGLGVLFTYGVRDGIRIFAIPCGACLGVFGAFGWLGVPLNLFHLLGAFLGVCLTHNYSIFTATSAYRHEPPPVSVRMSALTTAASFGVLALSGIPVVRALGLTVAAMVVTALLVIELEHLKPLAPPSDDRR